MRVRFLISTMAALTAGFAAHAQTPVVTGVFNSATSGVSGPIAPGELMSVAGQNLGDASQVNCGSATGFTTSCGGVSVTIGATAAAVRSESATVLIIQASYSLTPGNYPLGSSGLSGARRFNPRRSLWLSRQPRHNSTLRRSTACRLRAA